MQKKYQSLGDFRRAEAALWQSDWLNAQYRQVNDRFEDRLLHAVTVRDEIRRGIRQSDEQIEVTAYAWIARYLSKLTRYTRLEDVVIGDVDGAIVFDLLDKFSQFEPYFTADQFWRHYCAKTNLAGAYQTRTFDDDRQVIAVKRGLKTAQSSPAALYRIADKNLPKVGDIQLVLYQNGRVACATRTNAVAVVPFDQVGRMQAHYEAAGDGSLAYWQMTRQLFFKRALAAAQLQFNELTPIVLERYRVIATPFDLVYN